MKSASLNKQIFISSEIGRLRKLLIHSPDGGIGKIIPSKFKDWLYEDTVHLMQMQKEYNNFVKVLLFFLDPDKAVVLKEASKAKKGNMYKPDKPEFYNSSVVIEAQKILGDILEDQTIRIRIVSAICALEGCSKSVQDELEKLPGQQLSKALITGIIGDVEESGKKFIFPPIPNFVFTRDIGVVIKDHLLLSRTAKQARKRESIIAKYLAYYSLFEHNTSKIIEITEDNDFFLESEFTQQSKVVTIEGGDIMMISPKHLIVGCSERTSPSAVDAIIHKVFSKPQLGIEKISVLMISQDRATMHIDTIFSQIRRDAWVIYGLFSEVLRKQEIEKKIDFSVEFIDDNKKKENNIKITQFVKSEGSNYFADGKNIEKKLLKGLEDLVKQVSIIDFGVKENDVKIIYCGNDEFPYNEREQWTDACNLLCISEGVVIGYDRNEKTAQAFKEKLGFTIIKSEDLFAKFESGEMKPSNVQNTLILIPSTELSRARGGSHCMSLPLLRDEI